MDLGMLVIPVWAIRQTIAYHKPTRVTTKEPAGSLRALFSCTGVCFGSGWSESFT